MDCGLAIVIAGEWSGTQKPRAIGQCLLSRPGSEFALQAPVIQLWNFTPPCALLTFSITLADKMQVEAILHA
jgi:hypothetical protein